MSNFSTFFPGSGSGGGGTEINQFYLPGVIDHTSDTFTDADGAVYLKTGVTKSGVTYPNAYSPGQGVITSNFLPGFGSNRGSLQNLPGENKFIVNTMGYFQSGNTTNFYIIDRSNLPPVTPIPSTTNVYPPSSIDNRYYSPAVRNWVSGKRYSFSTTSPHNDQGAGFNANAQISEVSGSWPSYTQVAGTSITLAYNVAGVLPGYNVPATGYGAYESIFRPSITGVTDPTGLGFMMFRMAEGSGFSFYWTICLGDGSVQREGVIATGTTSGMNYSLMNQQEDGKAYFSSRYNNNPNGPELQQFNPIDLSLIGTKTTLTGSIGSANVNINEGGNMKGGYFVQGGTVNTFYASLSPGITIQNAVINEIGPFVGSTTAFYSNLVDASGTTISSEDKRLYVKVSS
jgi:hypothetical protein